MTTHAAMPGTSLLSSVEQGVNLARLGLAAVLVTHVEPLLFVPDPLAFLAASSRRLSHGVFWSQQRSGQTFAGAGEALRIASSGPLRFAAASAAIRTLQQSIVSNDGHAVFPAVGGFAFDPGAPAGAHWAEFPDGLLEVPATLLQSHGDTALLRVTMRVDSAMNAEHAHDRMASLLQQARAWAGATVEEAPQAKTSCTLSLPSRESWEASVAAAIERIARGALAKVVLAREERLIAEGPFSPIGTLRQLRTRDPRATLFAMQSGDSWFVGATPERLVRLAAGHVDVTCLAGSIAVGQNAAEQRALAERLLGSAKDREEHEIVVRSTMSALRDVCSSVERARGTPRVVSAGYVQHLETPIAATLAADGTLLDLVARLHPTPAVGGYPREAALRLIRELETIDRGWYAGPFGWTDLDGSGEFAVAIRSALISGETASLYAGCGIVADSKPAEEFAETRLKLEPMLAALGAG